MSTKQYAKKIKVGGSKKFVYDMEAHEAIERLSALMCAASEFTLEESSSPLFEVTNPAVAGLYIANIGGYMMLVKDGNVYAAKLNPSNWNYFADGTQVGDASKFETMVHVPDCYFKGAGKKLTFGGLHPVDGGKKFGSPNWVGAYEMYVDGNNKGHSRPDVSPSHSQKMGVFWQNAQNLHGDFGLANYGFHCLINALFQAKFGNLNSQQAVGAGGQTSSWDAWRNVNMGLTRLLGDGTGKVLYNDQTVGDQFETKLFGFEGLWGKLWEFRPGIRFHYADGVRTAIINDGNPTSFNGDDPVFVDAGRTVECTCSGTNGGFITNMVLGENWDMIPIHQGGGETTYYCDGHWYTQDATDRLLYVGGDAYDGARCGLAFSISDRGFSVSGAYIGARLAFYGEPELVSGAELVALAAV